VLIGPGHLTHQITPVLGQEGDYDVISRVKTIGKKTQLDCAAALSRIASLGTQRFFRHASQVTRKEVLETNRYKGTLTEIGHVPSFSSRPNNP